ncbi:MAG TPA: recombinase family protein [Pirellulaceae bacterium]
MADSVLPTPAAGGNGRRRRRSKEERGLPDDDSLLALATVWLECQNRLWPELVAAGVIPANTPENAKSLANAFKRRFLGLDPVRLALPSGLKVELAASYLRYSDANSNPRSNAQQLQLQLEKARQHNRFIPWELVAADAAVTGTHDERWGYQLIKQVIIDVSINASTLYIDEIGRASRDAVEALSLGRKLQDNEKLLIGVSDGFDLSNPFSRMMLHVYAMMQDWFIEQLRSKVNRGMNDAFDLGANIGRPPTGYKLVPMRDKDGNKVLGRDSAELKMLAIDEQTCRYVERAFVLYTVKKKSAIYIARYFNRLRVDGRTNWAPSQIVKLLRRLTYRGIKTYRMSKHVI